MDRFHSTESNLAVDKKKQKRVSIINDVKDEKGNATDGNSTTLGAKKEGKEQQNNTHHSHIHKNHSHSHPKRRMSLDNQVISLVARF